MTPMRTKPHSRSPKPASTGGTSRRGAIGSMTAAEWNAAQTERRNKSKSDKNAAIAERATFSLIAALRLKFGADLVVEREYLFAAKLKRRWRLDLFLPHYNIAIELEGVNASGTSRHRTAQGYAADMEKYNYAAIFGITVLRFATHEVLKSAEFAAKFIHEVATNTHQLRK